MLSTLFIALLIQVNAFAEILDLGNGLKINLPNNFSYFQETLEHSYFKEMKIEDKQKWK